MGASLKFNAPASHRYHLGESTCSVLDEADLLIVLESEVPWLPEAQHPRHAAHGPRPGPLSDLSPIPDSDLYCRASGGHGVRVTDPHALTDAIRDGLRIVREKRQHVLLNVICA